MQLIADDFGQRWWVYEKYIEVLFRLNFLVLPAGSECSIVLLSSLYQKKFESKLQQICCLIRVDVGHMCSDPRALIDERKCVNLHGIIAVHIPRIQDGLKVFLIRYTQITDQVVCHRRVNRVWQVIDWSPEHRLVGQWVLWSFLSFFPILLCL